MNAPAEDEQARVVSSARSSRHQRQCGMHCGIEFGFLLNPRGHQTAGIDRDKNRLVAFHLILARDQLAAARGRGPRDMPHLVALNIITQRFEVAAFTAPLRFAARGDE